MSVDTLSLAKELRAADFASPQAEAIAAAIGRSVTETTATKVDLAQIEERLGARITHQGADLRTEIAQLGGELRTELAKLDTKIEASTNKLLFWFIGTQLVVVGIVITVIKLVPAQGL